jgi:hypothetical protein
MLFLSLHSAKSSSTIELPSRQVDQSIFASLQANDEAISYDLSNAVGVKRAHQPRDCLVAENALRNNISGHIISRLHILQ